MSAADLFFRPTLASGRHFLLSCLIAAKASWAAYFLYSEHYAAAATAGLAFLSLLLKQWMSASQLRSLQFAGLMLLAASMIILGASTLSYLPLVAGWLATAAFWMSGRERILMIALGEGAWITYGHMTGQTAVIGMSLAAIGFLAFLHLRRGDTRKGALLSPTMI